MATTTVPPSAADQAVLDQIQKSFESRAKIAASREQVAGRRREADAQFIASLLAGSFEGAQVLSALTAWKQQDAAFEAQLNALAEVQQKIQQSLVRLREEKPGAVKQMLLKEEARLRELIGKSSDQAAALQKQLDEIREWLDKLEGGAVASPPRKGGAATSA
jgi:hypothetical protein